MNYCEKCHILCEDTACPRCGNKFVCPPKAEDYVFLEEKEFLWAELLEGALKEEGIAVVSDESITGVWKTKIIGSLREQHRLYVPYGDLERARQIAAEMFNEASFTADFSWEEEET